MLKDSSVSERFQLTSSRLKNASEHDLNNFTFIVDGEKYECGRVQACFMSQRVCDMMLSDDSVDAFVIGINDPEHHFKDVVTLMNGGSIEISLSNLQFLESVSRQLDNLELFSKILEMRLRDGEIDESKVIDRLRLKHEFNLNCDLEFSFLAERFCDFKSNFIMNIGIDDVECVLSHKSLKLRSENDLFDLVNEMISQDERFSSLLRFIEIRFLDCEHLDLFLKQVFPDFLYSSLWASICNCLHSYYETINYYDLQVQMNKIDRFLKNEKVFEFKDEPFNGIICHLRKECGGNVHQKGVVEIIASSTGGNQCHQVTDYGWNSYFNTQDEENSWVRFNFKTRKVCLTSYSLKSGTWHLLRWVIEGSNNGSEWKVIDSRDTKDLDGHYFVKTFKCNQGNNEFYRYLRLFQSARSNSNGDSELQLSGIEFFGVLD